MCRMTELESFTHNMAMIQPSFTSSKWNMCESFGLKFHLPYLHKPQMFFFEIPLFGNTVIFATEFVIL